MSVQQLARKNPGNGRSVYTLTHKGIVPYWKRGGGPDVNDGYVRGCQSSRPGVVRSTRWRGWTSEIFPGPPDRGFDWKADRTYLDRVHQWQYFGGSLWGSSEKTVQGPRGRKGRPRTQRRLGKLSGPQP